MRCLSHDFEEADGYSYQSRVRGVLKGLGFTEAEYQLPISLLSGGQRIPDCPWQNSAFKAGSLVVG